MPRTLINGRSGAEVSTLDRGFTLGDGLFETIAVAAGKPLLWTEHMVRLRNDARRLLLPEPDPDVLHREACEAIASDTRGALRITWTRGMGARGYAIPDPTQPTRVVSFHPGPEPPDRPAPLHLCLCGTRLARQPVLAGIKHLNRLEQILARAEVDAMGVDEGVMLDTEDHPVEATMSNLFVVRKDVLLTPELTTSGVSGIMRGKVLEQAEKLGLVSETGRYSLSVLDRADEVFLTNSIRGVQPVASIADRSLEAPGPVTIRLIDSLRRYW